MKMKPIRRVYLDTNIYCRPLDNQKDRRIHTETEAFLEIVNAAEKGQIAIISSDYVKFEIEQIQDTLKKKDVRGFEMILSKTNVTSSRELIILAQEFVSKCRLGSLDALHLATACIGKADFMLTCDDKIIDSTVCIEKLALAKGYRLKVRNPISYIKEKGD